MIIVPSGISVIIGVHRISHVFRRMISSLPLMVRSQLSDCISFDGSRPHGGCIVFHTFG